MDLGFRRDFPLHARGSLAQSRTAEDDAAFLANHILRAQPRNGSERRTCRLDPAVLIHHDECAGDVIKNGL